MCMMYMFMYMCMYTYIEYLQTHVYIHIQLDHVFNNIKAFGAMRPILAKTMILTRPSYMYVCRYVGRVLGAYLQTEKEEKEKEKE